MYKVRIYNKRVKGVFSAAYAYQLGDLLGSIASTIDEPLTVEIQYISDETQKEDE